MGLSAVAAWSAARLEPMRSDWREQRDPREAERALVRRMLAGEESAFETFSAAYIPTVYRFAQRRVGDRELTREIVQTTVCKAIAKLRTFRGEAGLITWLCACCQNEIAGHFRRQSRTAQEVALTDDAIAAEPGLEPGTPGPEQALLRKEKAQLVHAALDALPPHYSRALEWKYLDRLSVDEIAVRLDVRPKAAESLLTRARQSFRDVYERVATGGGTPDDRIEDDERRKRTGPWKTIKKVHD
jgi:RNA polymerase sigma-70 factor, ECF subfamily